MIGASPLSTRFCVLIALALAACGPPTAFPDGGSERPIILEVTISEPAVEGSELTVRGLGLDLLGDRPQLSVDQDGPIGVLDGQVAENGELRFSLAAIVTDRLGPGRHEVDLVATGQGIESEPFRAEFRIVTDLPVDLFDAPSGEQHRNDLAVLSGNGFISESEGEIVAHFVGTYTRDSGGATADVDARLPVTPVERGDRERGVIVLSTQIGGQQPGTFDGTVTLESTLRTGQTSRSLAVASNMHFNPPELFSLEPLQASLGQLLTVRGVGFLGGSDRPGEATVLDVVGEFTPVNGTPEPFEESIVLSYISGQELTFSIDTMIEDARIVSVLFGHARGRFAGTATPVTLMTGEPSLAGQTIPFGFELGAVRQVVHVRFLQGFYGSLVRFGLSSAAPEIEARVEERMRGIFEGFNVDLRFGAAPTDFAVTSYSVVEIGGPDPNGIGLFGYDNTPGKDRFNVRLHDQIGGTNAETQADRAPGYGGVFVESFLYWSEHPELPGDRPLGAPDPQPVFDETFDPVRAQPATRAEAMGNGDAARNAAVRTAVNALGSIIGETTSHEIGHSLGMAQPYGSPTIYHNDFDGDGCIMDSGGDRPLGERMALPGFATTQWCYDHPEYLREILGD